MLTNSRLVLASGNGGKLYEFSKLFSDYKTEVIPQTDLGVDPPEETGLSFIENALLKARHASAVTQIPSLADDSGLVVPALGGAPGLYSARYAGSHASDQDNLNLLLDRMKNLSGVDREGHYICVLALSVIQPIQIRLLSSVVGTGGLLTRPVARVDLVTIPFFSRMGFIRRLLSSTQKRKIS